MSQIDAALQVALAAQPGASSSSSAGGSASAMQVDPSHAVSSPSKPPFALVKSVDPKGPGATAVGPPP